MKIDESQLVLSGQHSFASERSVEVSSQASFRMIFTEAAQAAETSPASGTARGAGPERIRFLLAQLIAEVLALISGQASANVVDVRDVVSTDSPDQAPRRVGEFTWASQTTETIREHESSDFAARGVVRTTDGRAIDFKLDLALCRDYQCERKTVEGGTVELRDPLVINFDGQGAELSDATFNFDLASDGRSESVHALAGGSAFLALDLNGDGRINDGRELFGAQSGDGFADLAALDSDGNHWLDEADPAFADLKAWSRNADGTDSLVSLKDQGVGALYLESAATPFSLKDDGNRLRGQVRASGVYLCEDGRAGSLQQIDLAV
jgi:hypothetical protein